MIYLGRIESTSHLLTSDPPATRGEPDPLGEWLLWRKQPPGGGREGERGGEREREREREGEQMLRQINFVP